MMPCVAIDETSKSFPKPKDIKTRPSTILSEDPSWLYCQLEQDANLLLIDCRPFSEYCKAHIEGAINLTISDLMLRRLKKGNMQLSSLLNSEAAKKKFSLRTTVERIVVCDSNSSREHPTNCKVEYLLSKLSEDNRVCFLEGGFTRFEESYPHLCQCGEGNEAGKTMFSLSSLKISDNNNNLELDNAKYGEMKKESCLYRPDSAGPIEIIPHLFLGNKKDSSDRSSLENHRISYILNVTHDLPNEFESEQKFKYMKLPVQDDCDGNLFDCFPQAFGFIDMARKEEQNVLVHCVGGISRSSTVVIAYLMLKEKYSLNDAYDFVKAKKSNIAPNFSFMQQLLDFESERTLIDCQSPSPNRDASLNSASPFSIESETSDDSIASC